MATANISRPERHRVRSVGNQARAHPAAKTEEVLHRELRRLQKALAVLTCLQEAALNEAEVDYADVAAVVCDLVDKVLFELDLVGLSGEPHDPDDTGA